jgi:hypothetical protein
MQSALRRTVAVLTLSTALIGSSAALAAPANAAKWTYDDAVGDVVRESVSSGDEQVPAPEWTRSDITKVVGIHQGRTLTIKIRTRSRAAGFLMTSSIIRTPRKRFWLSSMRMPGLMNGVSLDDTTKSKTPKCRGLHRSFDESRTVMTLRVPRSCLGNPKWVRFSVTTYSADPFSDDDFNYSDDGLREGVSPYGMGKMSPKLRHG